MAQIRDYLWLLPFIGSILAAISIFTPAAVSTIGTGTFLQYMDGVYIHIGDGLGPYGEYTPSFGFIPIPILMMVGIICLILILVSTIITFISSLTHRKSEAPASWLVLGILFLVAAIYYIAGMGVGFMMWGVIEFEFGPTLNFWELYTPSFGAIAPFISGGLAITGYIVSKFTGKEQMKIAPITKDTTPVSIEGGPATEYIPQPIPIEVSESIKFCPACGEKIPNADAQFCPGCGTDLKIN